VTVPNNISTNLSTLLSEFGPKYFAAGVSSKAPLIGSGALKKIPVEGEEFVATLYPVSNHALGFALDGGYLPVGGSGLPVKARAMPTALVAHISMGAIASKMRLPVEQRIKQLDLELKNRAAAAGRQLDRAIIGGGVAPQAGTTWSGTAANSTATVSFLDISLFKPGMAVDYLDASSTSFVVRVTAVTPSAVGANTANASGTVSFINDVPNPATGSVVALTDTTIATGDSFRLRGYSAGFGGALTAQGAMPNSFDDMAGSSTYNTTFMGVDPSTAANGPLNWVAHYLSLGAAYSQEAASAFHSRISAMSDCPPDIVVCHPQTAAAHRASGDFHGAVFGVSAGLSAGHHKPIDRSLDKYGSVYEDDGLRLSGARVISDQSCQIGRIIFFDSEHTKLGVWAEMGPDEEAGDAELLDRTYYKRAVQFSGLYNLVTDLRSSVGILDGISGF
jgi:hypothetical protein